MWMANAGLGDSGALAAIDAFIDDQLDQLVELVQTLVRFQTVSVDLEPGSDHRANEEDRLQEVVADRLARLRADVDQWEPDPAEFSRHPMMPPWHHWRGRPLTVGTLRGAGTGRSLIVNGHVDVVDPGNAAAWSSPPFAAELRDGKIFGRGAVDMKGGLAAALFALEALTANGVRLAGDVIFEAVSDEESCAMGTVAAIARGYRADAGLVPEPTQLHCWIATRGLLHGSFTVPGRSAHAEVNQADWQDGGGVNAIELAVPLIESVLALSRSWAGRSDKQHRLLSSPQVQPTMIDGGTFIANVPDRCTVKLNATYLPANADETGYGSAPRAEIMDAVAAAGAGTRWLDDHPVTWSWATDYPPSEIDGGEAILTTVCVAARSLGQRCESRGIDTTYDGALLTRLAGVPSPAFGPGDLARAHATDEWIGVDELVLGAKAYARAIVAWCGVAA
jgi:acetylornithine deacetylase